MEKFSSQRALFKKKNNTKRLKTDLKMSYQVLEKYSKAEATPKFYRQFFFPPLVYRRT